MPLSDRFRRRLPHNGPAAVRHADASGPSVSLWALVGFAHAALGALAIFNGGTTLIFQVSGGQAAAPLGALLVLVAGAGLALAGVWLQAGQRRGAALGALLDAGLGTLLALGGGVAFIVPLVLLAGAVYVWPTLHPAHLNCIGFSSRH